MKKFTSILMSVAAGLLVLSACAQPVSPAASSATPETRPAVNTPAPVIKITAEPPATPTAVAPAGAGQGVPAIVVEPDNTPQPVAITPAIPSADEPKTVTLDDQGKTVHLAVGERFLLKLGETYVWELNLSDPNVVSRVKNIAVVRGAQGVYIADHAGTVTLTATGDPLCRQSKPACGQPSLMFSVTLVVS
jgi:hypothetical protein